MNKDYSNKDALKQQSNKDPRQDASKSIPSADKNKQSVPPSSTSMNQQSKNR